MIKENDKVICMTPDDEETIKKGKEYTVISVEEALDEEFITVLNDLGDKSEYISTRFKKLDKVYPKESENIEELFSFKAGEKIKIINPDSCEFDPGEILKYEPGTIWEIYEDVTNKKYTIKVKDKRSDCGYGTIFISNIERLEDEKEDKKIKSILDYTLSELESIVNIKKKILENEKLIEKYTKQIEEDKKYLEEILCV